MVAGPFLCRMFGIVRELSMKDRIKYFGVTLEAHKDNLLGYFSVLGGCTLIGVYLSMI